jgi:hypothetical protein
MITLMEAAAFYRESAARCEEELATVVVTVVERAEVLARNFIGHEQDGWPMAWEPLSTATTDGFRHELGFWVIGKEELGFGGAESPLLRTGTLRDSIDSNAVGLFGEVGSNEKSALYNELGTPGALYPIPPRPFIAKGMMDASYDIEELAGAVAFGLLLPKV